MALSYTLISETTVGNGIDARSAENQLDLGFVQDALNIEFREGSARKRKGHEGHCGYLPVRVSQLDYEVDGTITLSLDGSVNLSTLRSTPLQIYGRTSVDTTASGGDWSEEDTSRYYAEFSADIRRVLAVGTGTETIDAGDHGYTTDAIFVGLAESTATSTLDWSQFLPDRINVDQGTLDIDVEYTVDASQDATSNGIYAYYLSRAASAGEVYIHTQSVTGSASPTTFSIGVGTHQLSNFNILVRAYEDVAGTWREWIPESVTIAPNGDVEVTGDISVGAARDFRIILSAAPASNFTTGEIPSGAIESITIPQPDSPFIFTGIYLSSGGGLEQVIPDSVTYSQSSDEITLTFTNDTGSGANFEIYWDFGEITTNRLTVTGSTLTGPAYSDERPQLTIWGLCQGWLYSTSDATEGWVTHLDSYRREGEERIIAGVGGVLHRGLTREEAGDTYNMPLLYPRLRARLSADQTVEPLFSDTGTTPSRARGSIQSNSASTGYVEVVSAVYDEGTGYTKYTLSLPGLSVVGAGSVSDTISTLENYADILTVTGMHDSRFEGAFPIRDVDDSTPDQLTFSVENTAVSSSDLDSEGDLSGRAAVLTDEVTFTSTLEFLPGDLLLSNLFGEDEQYRISSVSGNSALIADVSQARDLPGGLRVVGQRKSRVLPLRTSTALADVTSFVAGDTVLYSELDRNLRAEWIIPSGNETVSVVGDGETATVTLSSSVQYDIGRYILFANAGPYSGVHQITGIPSPTSLTFASTSTVSTSATLVGNAVVLDEEITWKDSNGNLTTLDVACRWIPIEAPRSTQDLPLSTYFQHLDAYTYETQVPVRSVMSNDNMYLTNGLDEVYKFDGTSIYRAGLPRWQPGLYISVDPGSGIAVDTARYEYTAVSSVDAETDELAVPTVTGLSVGDTLTDSDTGTKVTIRGIVPDTPAIQIDSGSGITTGADDVLRPSVVYQYYFRLNSVDSNGNLIASAMVQSEDYTVELSQDSTVRLKLVGLPVLGNYDYDRLEVEVYRTLANQNAPYYRITTLPLSYNGDGDGYLVVEDTLSDDTLTAADLDVTSSVLTFGELGNTWNQPYRSKYITVAGNRLVQANLRSYPELDIQLDGSTTLTDTDFVSAGRNRWLLRRDSTDTATSTNMLGRIGLEVTDSTTAVSGISQTASGFTVDIPGHGLTPATAGQWVYLTSISGSAPQLEVTGHFQVAEVVDATTLRIVDRLAADAVSLTAPGVAVLASDPFDIPVYIPADDLAHGQRRAASASVRRRVATRLAAAINSVVRTVDTSISGYEEYTPWVVAEAGSDYELGQIVVRFPQHQDTVPELELDSDIENAPFRVFVDGILRPVLQRDGSYVRSVGSSERLYPSRLSVSYPNFPELHDNSGGAESTSDSVIDINPSDGQQITAVMPFFGQSTSSDSAQENILVVFKTSSVYLVDVGNRVVNKIDSQGQGCTAPRSPVQTRNGVIFANDSGIYEIDRSYELRYVGRNVDRLWGESVNRSRLDLAVGHNFPGQRQYKLSVPLGDDNACSEVYVYDHSRRDQGHPGAWSRFDAHAATSWCNLEPQAFFSTTDGRVFRLRDAGDESDYRDDNQAITARLTGRAHDYGTRGIRKAVSHLVSHFRPQTEEEVHQISVGVDFAQELESTTEISIGTREAETGISDLVPRQIYPVRSGLPRSRGVYFQFQWENGEKDQGFWLAGYDMRVAVVGTRGILEAANTPGND